MPAAVPASPPRTRTPTPPAQERPNSPWPRPRPEWPGFRAEGAYGSSSELCPPAEGQPAELIRVRLKYTDDRRSAISGLRRVSRPGQRHYAPAGGIRKVQGGMGTAIVSTSRGVMTGHAARQAGAGGEGVAEGWG